MPINDELYDRIIHSRAGLIKNEHSTVRRIRSVFKNVMKEIDISLTDLPDSALPSFGTRQKFEMERKINEFMFNGRDRSLGLVEDSMLNAARRENRELYSGFVKELPSDLSGLGFSAYEVPEDLLVAILDQPVLGDFTQTLTGYKGKFGGDTRALVDRALGASALQGESVPEISRRLRGIVDRQGTALAMFSRTAIQTAAFRAQDAFFKRNSDLIKRKKYTATFDVNTCPICAGYDGRVYGLDGGPYIPVHVGCRCTFTPVLKSYKEMGIKRSEIPPSTRWTMDGRVPETLPLDKWILSKLHDPKRGDEWTKKLSKTWGAGRVKLFKSGKVDLADLATRTRGKERIIRMGPLRKKAKERVA